MASGSFSSRFPPITLSAATRDPYHRHPGGTVDRLPQARQEIALAAGGLRLGAARVPAIRAGWRQHEAYGRLEQVLGEVGPSAQPWRSRGLSVTPGGQRADHELHEQVAAMPEAAPVEAGQLPGLPPKCNGRPRCCGRSPLWPPPVARPLRRRAPRTAARPRRPPARPWPGRPLAFPRHWLPRVQYCRSDPGPSPAGSELCRTLWRQN